MGKETRTRRRTTCSKLACDKAKKKKLAFGFAVLLSRCLALSFLLSFPSSSSSKLTQRSTSAQNDACDNTSAVEPPPRLSPVLFPALRPPPSALRSPARARPYPVLRPPPSPRTTPHA